LLLVFIEERGFKGATMEIQLDDIGSGERLLRERGQEEFKDDANTRDPNGALFGPAGWVATTTRYTMLSGPTETAGKS
jgi:hypothetical protein